MLNLLPVMHRVEPIVKSYQSPTLRAAEYRTFSVVAASSVSNKAHLSGIEEAQVLFALRNALETHGYRFVELNQSPDFIATIDGATEYKSAYVPPQTSTVPVWVPGQAVNSYGQFSGSFNTPRTWGTYTGNYSQTTYLPGYLTSYTYTQPGYTVGAHYPSIEVAILDRRSNQIVWSAVGTGCSNNGDFRVSSQLVLHKAIKEFPECSHRSENYPMPGEFGLRGAIVTLEGNAFIPVVLEVLQGSTGQQAGIQAGDLLFDIDGVETSNKPFSEIVRMLNRDPGKAVALRIYRVGKVIDLVVTASVPAKA